MKKIYGILIIVTLALFTLGIVFAGASLLAYINFPAFIVVVVPPCLLAIAAFGLHSFGRSFAVAFQNVAATTKELKVALAFFNVLGRVVLLSGFIGTMIGLIAMLANIEDPEQIGPAMSIALVTLFYSLVLMCIVTVPFKAAIHKRLAESDIAEESTA
jgi:flagellar motor component MotA